jgi:peptidoglycan/LPS O-acetylase OafA/YrhL
MAARFGLMFAAGAALLVLGDRVPLRGRWVALAALAIVPAAFLPDYRLVAAPLVAYAAVGFGALLTAPRWRFTQDLSYGTYVYAFPMQQLLACLGLAWLPVPVFALLSTAVTLPLAAASWFLVERNALRLKPGRRAPGPVVTP